MFISVPFQVRSITDELQPFQSGSVFYKRTTLTNAPYEHRVVFTVDGRITQKVESKQIKDWTGYLIFSIKDKITNFTVRNTGENG